ncbi:MAG TPA: hypothetical protein VHC95_11605 [Opitutales bacterium]|nr:hypothetical protein [Opitutales bacterium]
MAGIVLNLAIGHAVILLGLPIYLDALGTIIFTLLCGWRVGAAIGVLSFLIGGLLNAHMPYFIFSQLMIAAVTGLSAKHRGFKTLPRVVLTGVIMGVVAAIVSAPAVALAFHDGPSFWSATLEHLRVSFASANIWVEPTDKIIQCLIAWLVVRALPHPLKAQPSFAKHEDGR